MRFYTYLFLPLVSMHGEQTGLVLESLCYAMSYQPAGLPCDVGSKRKSVSQLLLRQSGADCDAVLFLGDLLRELNLAAISIRFLWKTPLQASHGTLPGPQQPSVSPKDSAVFGRTPFHSFHSELTQQDVSAWRSICRLPSQVAKNIEGFPAPCKLGYLLGHYFKTSITRSLVFMLWCEGILFKESISIRIFLVLIDHFPSCCDFPGMGRAVLIYASWRGGWLHLSGTCSTKKISLFMVLTKLCLLEKRNKPDISLSRSNECAV